MSLQQAMIRQAEACEALGSPFNARLLRLAAARLAPGTAVADRLLSWPGDLGPSGQSVPLRFAGVLHGLVLSARAPALVAAYPPNKVDDDTLWHAVEGALSDHADHAMVWLNSPPQTNEVARSAALIAAGHWLAARYDLPMILSEVGASAGLNLMWPRYGLDLPEGRFGPKDAVLTLRPDWSGDTPPPSPPRVLSGRGVDLNPLDIRDPQQALRLRAYVWPDQSARLTRLTQAIAAADAPVDRADALDWLPGRLDDQPEGTLHVVYHTVAWQYLPDDAQARGNAMFEAAGARATPTRPLARFQMEADGGRGAALCLTTWPGGETRPMGRADFHGRWLDWKN